MPLYSARKMMGRNGFVRGLLSSRIPCVNTTYLSHDLITIPTKKRKPLNLKSGANLTNRNRNREKMEAVAQARTTTTMGLGLLAEREKVV